MDKLHKLKLFKDLQEVSNRYSQLNIENNEIEDNKNLQELIINYKSNMDTIRKKANFISNYEKISINAFIIFLVLKDIKNIEKIKIEKLSQGILSQIQTLSLISI